MAGVATTLSITDRMTRVFERATRANERMNRTLEVTDRLSEQIDMDSAFRRAEASIQRAEAELNDFNNKQEQAEQGADKVKSAWGGVGGAVKAAMAAVSLKKVIGLSDTMTQTYARLNLMNDGLQTTAQLQDKIMASANRSRADYQTTADMISKLGMQAGDAFKSNDELIAFAEQLNKSFVIAGTGASGIDSTMYNLTQALASGVLRGQDLNAVMSNAMPIVKNIADYMGVSVGEIRDMAAEGQLSAEVVKNAMLAAAEQTNATFSQIPMTFSQVATIGSNLLLQAFEPVIQTIGKGAQWIYDNWSQIQPVFVSVAAGIGGAAVAWGIYTAAQWIATGAAKAFFTTLLSNPLTWIVLVVGLVVAAIARWVQAVGGIKIAWAIAVDRILWGWDNIKIGFFTGVYWVEGLLNKMRLGFATVSVAIQNIMGDMKTGVLVLLQGLVNGAIDIINGFINTLNKIPGVSIEVIDRVTFGTNAQLENNAAKQARADQLQDLRSDIDRKAADRDAALASMKADARAATAQRQADIALAKAEKAAAVTDTNTDTMVPFDAYGELEGIGRVGEVGKIRDDVNIAEEDLKFMRDVAEMRYVQNFVTLTPTVAMDVQNINQNADADYLLSEVERRLEEEFVAAAEGVYN